MSVNNPNFIALSELTSGIAGETAVRVVEDVPPTVALAQSLPRNSHIANGSLLLSGREQVALIYLQAGMVVRSITFVSATTAAVTPTNQWFSIRDLNRVLIRVTVDDTTTAWNANQAKTLLLSSAWTVPYSGFFYVGIMVAAGTVPSFTQATMTTGVSAIVPISVGFDNTNLGLTTPATAPATSAAYTAAQSVPYFYLA